MSKSQEKRKEAMRESGVLHKYQRYIQGIKVIVEAKSEEQADEKFKKYELKRTSEGVIEELAQSQNNDNNQQDVE